MTAQEESGAYEFGPFRLDVARRALFRDETQLPLTPKSFDTLLVLVEHAGAAVDKSTLLTRVWSDVAVEENSLAKAISEIRRALGEGSRAPQFVATLPGHGYRFIAAVKRFGTTSQPRRLAVLPLSVLSSAEADEYLGVGLADSLITRLSRLHQITVRPTRAILNFTSGEHGAVAAGRQLEVDCVLDGTVRRAGDRVRVTAQLVDVSTGAIGWAETFDETFTTMFTLEDVISERVVAALALGLTGKERQSLKRQHTDNPEAYPWYLKGRFYLAMRTADDCERAIASFQRVIAADPGDALAYSGIADAYVFLGVQALVMGGLAPAETFPRAKTAIEQAFRIDDGIAEAYTSQAQISLLYDWDSDAAEQAHLRSLTLDPHSASGRHAFALTQTFLTRHDAAMVEMQRALELDPLSPIINTNLGRVLFHARRYEEALTQLENTVRANPGFVVAHYRLGLAFEATRRYEDAIREFATAQRLSGNGPAPTAALAYALAIIGRRTEAERMVGSLLGTAERQYVAAPCIAEVYLALGAVDSAFEWFERGVAERSSMLVTLRVNPRYDGLREDHRFQSLIERVGLWRR
jgi:TolB-like protein